MKKHIIGYYILAITGFIIILGISIMDPILQDEKYHAFSDSAPLFGIPNFWNVISNLPFLLVSILGFSQLSFPKDQKRLYQVLFLGIGLVGIGSCYYHWNPTSETLVWDRLPMTITFMTLFTIIIGEFISKIWSKRLFLPLLGLGLFSILYWKMSSTGDLRLYGMVQFYPMVAIPVILIYFKDQQAATSGYWYLLAAYILAKYCEHYDPQIHDYFTVISGHSLKHIFAAFGLYCLVHAYKKRKEWIYQ